MKFVNFLRKFGAFLTAFGLACLIVGISRSCVEQPAIDDVFTVSLKYEDVLPQTGDTFDDFSATNERVITAAEFFDGRTIHHHDVAIFCDKTHREVVIRHKDVEIVRLPCSDGEITADLIRQPTRQTKEEHPYFKSGNWLRQPVK